MNEQRKQQVSIVDRLCKFKFKRRCRKRYWIGALALVVLVLGVFHAPLLRLVASVLIADERPPEHVDAIAVAQGDEVLATGIEQFQNGNAESILLFQTIARRVTSIGVLPAPEEYYRDRLTEMGIDDRLIITLSSNDRKGEWREAHLIDNWLRENSDKQVVILCPRFDSRRIRMTIDRVLPADRRENVTVQGIARHSCDETNWWHSREGWKAVFYCYVDLSYDWVYGEDEEAFPQWDPDEFESQLSESI